ncbi:MAG: hypothetical protein ACK50Q_01155 [Labrys sp. (in: a-proteobacteria)]
MASLGLYVAAGVASGIGQGMVEDARQKREMALEAMRNARQDQLRSEDRRFQLEDRTDQRAYEDRTRATERSNRIDDYKMQRDDRRSDELAQDERAAKRPGKTYVGEDGYTYEQSAGGGAPKLLKDETGKPIPNQGSDWNERRGLTADQKRRAVNEAFEPEGGIGDPNYRMAKVKLSRAGFSESAVATEIRADIEARYSDDPAKVAEKLKEAGIGAAPAAQAPTAKRTGPPGVMPPKPGTSGIPADLQVGERVQGNDGTTWRWTGKDWEPI